MKAAVIERHPELVVKEIPEPAVGDYDAFCEILYGATCSGTDTHIVEGNFPWISPLPTVLGHESIARVIRLGPKVRYLKEGDLVARVGTVPTGGYSVTWGGFAEYGIATDCRAAREDGLPREEWDAARKQQVLPAGTDPAAATMIITWRETLSYLNRMGVSAGKSILVIGSGGNGLSFIAHAANADAAQRVMVGSPVRESAARRAGATEYVDYKAPDVKQIISRICPDGFDFVIDAVGKEGLGDFGLSLLKAGGTIGIYGVDDFGRCTINPDSARGAFTVHKGYDEEETHDQVVRLFQAGKLDASIWLDMAHPFELDRIGEALEAVRSRKTVKALIRILG